MTDHPMTLRSAKKAKNSIGGVNEASSIQNCVPCSGTAALPAEAACAQAPPQPQCRALHFSSSSGGYGVEYRRYKVTKYMHLPHLLSRFAKLPLMDHFLVVSLPTMDKSGGLEGYRGVVPKAERAAAPFLMVVDEPGKTVEDKGYHWAEVRLQDDFKLDVSGLKTFEEYLARLSCKSRKNYRQRQRALAASALTIEYGPLPQGDKATVDRLWPLYEATGEKNGFLLLTKEDFYSWHLNTEGATLMQVKDTARGGELVCFCSAFRYKDVLVPMWIGLDYAHPLIMPCSVYFNVIYEFLRLAIADPAVNWVDLGPGRRKVKEGHLGAQAFPISGYVRCKTRVMKALVDSLMKRYFRMEHIMNDS